MLRINFLLLLSVLSGTISSAQDIGFVRQQIDTLCSPYFFGRGYEKDGALKAAAYLGEQFNSILTSKEDFVGFHKFEFNANTFPDTMEVRVKRLLGWKELEAGKDFILTGWSGGGKGTLTIKKLSDIAYETDTTKQYAVLLEEPENSKEWSFVQQGLKADFAKQPLYLVERKSKLTMTPSTEHYRHTVLHFDKGALPFFKKRIEVNIDSRWVVPQEGLNVVAQIKGTKYPDSLVVFTAHYDHLGGLGNQVYFPGASDNASGTVMLLDLARHYAANRPEFSVAFVAFSGEEIGLVGSKAFVAEPLFPLANISFVVNLDLTGAGEDGITVVNGDLHKQDFAKLSEINTAQKYLTAVNPRGEAANSDHYWFSQMGVPAFFIYTLGKNKAYHDIYDTPENLSLGGYEGLFKLVTDFANYKMK